MLLCVYKTYYTNILTFVGFFPIFVRYIKLESTKYSNKALERLFANFLVNLYF